MNNHNQQTGREHIGRVHFTHQRFGPIASSSAAAIGDINRHGFMHRPTGAEIPLHLFPKKFKDQYAVDALAKVDFAYIEIWKGYMVFQRLALLPTNY